MKRSTILLALVVALVAAAIPGTAMAEEVAPNDGPAPGIYPGTEPVPGAPAGSCLAEPTALRCPSASEIVVLPPVVNGEGETPGYVPILSPAEKSGFAGSAVTPQFAGYACDVRIVTGPNRDFAQVHTSAENYCLNGVGIAYQELYSELWKLQESGTEQYRGSDKAYKNGGGTLFAERNAACNAPHASFRWKAIAFGLAFLNGVLYSQTETNYKWLTCN